MDKDEKKYNTTVTALWGTKNGSGNLWGMSIDAKSFDQIQAAMESIKIGGKLLVKKLSDETRSKFKNPETAPEYFLEIVSPESVADFEAKNPRKRRDEGGL